VRPRGQTRAAQPVVVGGGLIGCEAAAGLAALGVATTIVAAEPVPLRRRFGDDVGERVAKLLSRSGVRFLGSTAVTAVDDTGVTLDSGETIHNVTARRRIPAEHRAAWPA
jgi:3-phenylpropionate/trans-cinnamate dioxygenase ferredoxin reductase subunit